MGGCRGVKVLGLKLPGQYYIKGLPKGPPVEVACVQISTCGRTSSRGELAGVNEAFHTSFRVEGSKKWNLPKYSLTTLGNVGEHWEVPSVAFFERGKSGALKGVFKLVMIRRVPLHKAYMRRIRGR